MNAVEIEEAVSGLAAKPFDRAEFPFAFLEAFGTKDVTVARLRKGSGNTSDVPGAVLQARHIHLAACAPGEVVATMTALRASPKTAANKCKFALATDGVDVEACDLVADEHLACLYTELGQRFGFFLPLAGISTVKQLKDNPTDVKATGRLNKLYVELLRENPDWATEAKRPELNRLMARLIFCFFAEDTGIFVGDAIFTKTVEQFSDAQSGNTHEIVAELFRAMATPIKARAAGNFRPWADAFPFVNGGLFSDAGEVPRFSRPARNSLLRAGELHWQQINPDIFGSMIQAVADDDERGSLGLHYTSVPNILKVLNPLFLDDLREKLAEAGDSIRKLRALRRRIAAIRVFDPACGSGNFLVIAYIQMREIEHDIVTRTGDDATSLIPLTNFYGIEIKHFAAEIARLALLIAEFQCDARLISQQAARSMVLPLHKTGQVHVGNALRMDWLEVCPPVVGTYEEHDLGGPTGRLALDSIDTPPELETFLCGNPPYQGSVNQTSAQKNDMASIFANELEKFKDLDYVSSWLLLASKYMTLARCAAAFVTTNSICQGEQVALLWPLLFLRGIKIIFAHRSFLWSNNASNNAGVSCVVVGLGQPMGMRKIFDGTERRDVRNIGPYLLPMNDMYVVKRSNPLSDIGIMQSGNKATDDGNFVLSAEERQEILSKWPDADVYLKRYVGSKEIIQGGDRWALWIPDDRLEAAMEVDEFRTRVGRVAEFRRLSRGKQANDHFDRAHSFVFAPHRDTCAIAVAAVSSERREFLPCDYITGDKLVSNLASVIYDPKIWNFSIISSKLHLSWIATVCGKLETRYRYSNTLGWNTFPVPPLTTHDKADLTACAEAILLAREAHFPATIADLYDPDAMPDDLRRAHDRNDETLERIYIGRRFRNDTERLEKLFEMYAAMTAGEGAEKKTKPLNRRRPLAAV